MFFIYLFIYLIALTIMLLTVVASNKVYHTEQKIKQIKKHKDKDK
jgi:uncharacterized membrane protein